MTNIRMMLVAISWALLLSACGATHPNGELVSGNPAQQDSGKSAQQGAASPEQDSANPPQQNSGSPAQQELASGIASYENENLKLSEKKLLSALNLGLHGKRDQVLAHKYLAFISCASHRKTRCRHEFMKALEIDPAFDLSPAEAGHPLWGAVFQAEKAKYAKTNFANSGH